MKKKAILIVTLSARARLKRVRSCLSFQTTLPFARVTDARQRGTLLGRKNNGYQVNVKRIVFILICACGFQSKKSLAQINLVPNPSFEDTIQCPNGQGQVSYCKNWFNPTDNSPDYFHNCGMPSVPNNFPIGFQYARTGIAYVGLTPLYNTPNGREYIEVKLLDSMIQGKQYQIEFFVALAELSDSAIDRIGIYISKDSVYNHNSFLLNLPYQPQIENLQGNFIADTLNWIKISGMYNAQGGEKFITIGNFYPDSLTGVVSVPASWSAIAYYYIDDVSVVDSGWVGIEEEQKQHSFSKVYPNPSSGKFTLSSEITKGEIAIYNVHGEKVFTSTINHGSTSLTTGQPSTFDISAQPDGIYFVRIQTAEGMLNKKVVVLR